jgi:HlyD family secretion protein
VVFYLPEDKIGDVDYNSKIQLEYAGEKISGLIKFIDVKSEYTPRDLQTEANKSKTSFKVKALVPKQSALKPGLEVKVTLSN